MTEKTADFVRFVWIGLSILASGAFFWVQEPVALSGALWLVAMIAIYVLLDYLLDGSTTFDLADLREELKNEDSHEDRPSNGPPSPPPPPEQM